MMKLLILIVATCVVGGRGNGISATLNSGTTNLGYGYLVPNCVLHQSRNRTYGKRTHPAESDDDFHDLGNWLGLGYGNGRGRMLVGDKSHPSGSFRCTALAALVLSLCEEKCEPGSTFMEDCNKCRCGLDGQKACTRKACPPNELSDDSQARTDAQNGDSLSSADEKDEVHVQTNGQVCTPNEIKMKDCNRCRCANNGIGWFCTRRACPPREKRSAPAPSEKCTPGAVFRSEDDCNTCYCNDNGIVACTRKACFSEPPQKTKRETRPECTPGTTFKSEDGCNTCFCSETGMAACTMKACYSAPPQKTKRDTAPSGDEKCTPGTTFKSEDGCNSCFCTETGMAACTLKACYSAPPQKTKRQTLPQSDIAPGAPGFSCQPKSSFKYQCNTCLCSDDGKMAGCTFKYCVPGEW